MVFKLNAPPPFEPTLYPQSYSASIRWRVLIGSAGGIISIWGVLGVWYFGTGHEIRTFMQQAVMVGISMSAILLGLWCAVGILKARIVLTSRDLQLFGIIRTTVLRRHEIVGYRVRNVQGIDFVELESKLPEREKHKTTKIGLYFKPDVAFDAWFHGINNFDALEIEASMREVEEDVELGRTPEDRLGNVKRARKIAGVLQTVSIVFFVVWAIFYPRPYTLVIFLLVILPWFAMWMCWRYKGAYSIEDSGHNSMRADLTLLLVMPGFLLSLRALQDVNLLDATQLILPGFFGLAIMLACLLRVAPVYRTKLGKLLLTAVLLFTYPISTMAIANFLLDTAEPVKNRIEVLGKRHTTGRGASQYFRVSAWGPYRGENEIKVPHEMYRQTQVGQTICLQHHPGALHMGWYSFGRSIDCPP